MDNSDRNSDSKISETNQQGMAEPKNPQEPQAVNEQPAPSKPKFRKNLIFSAAGVVVLLLAIGLGWWLGHPNKAAAPAKNTSSTQTTNPASSSSSVASGNTKNNTIDMSKLPLGDGKVTTTGAKQGYVYSCTSNFKGGGAEHAGSWINGSTWDYNTKPTVNGNVSWSNAKFSATLSGSSRILSGNGLPVNTPTGVFPIQSGTTAYQYDRNPNSIIAYNVSYTLPANPTVASSPSCVGLGPIGYMLNGVAIFNALDASGRDAAAHEIQDKCQGHPQGAGIYHYHSMSSCIKNEDANNTLVGYALDGFGIYSDRNANGKQYTTADLDACHGITSKIEWDGKMVNMYHYVLTEDYPYSIGCFRGTPLTQHQQNQTPNQRPRP